MRERCRECEEGSRERTEEKGMGGDAPWLLSGVGKIESA